MCRKFEIFSKLAHFFVKFWQLIGAAQLTQLREVKSAQNLTREDGVRFRQNYEKKLDGIPSKKERQKFTFLPHLKEKFLNRFRPFFQIFLNN